MSIFDFFSKRTYPDTNVVQFPGRAPGASSAPPAPPRPAEPEPDEEPIKIYYRFGITNDSNRVAFNMGYSEITLNKEGCQQMINQLTFFMNQLNDEEDE